MDPLDGDFYERNFYPFSNFSSFKLRWNGIVFDTSEHAYHFEKFNTDQPRARRIQSFIATGTNSAHEAFEVGSDPANREWRRVDWDNSIVVAKAEGENIRPIRRVKVVIMKQLLVSKLEQHPYVAKKLRQAFDAKVKLSERSWRDSFWGTGEDGKGEDWMGRLWNEIGKERFG